MSDIDLPPDTAAAPPARTDRNDRADRTGRRYIGPPPLAPALAHTVLFATSIVVGTSAGVFSRPDTAASSVTAHLSDQVAAAQVVAVLQVASAVTLGVFTAAAAAAVRARTPRLAGLDIARFGGYGAALLLAVSGLATWSAANLVDGVDGVDGVDAAAGGASTSAAVKALTLLSFATGGAGYVALLGLLLAGLAVPLFLGRLAPRWVGGTGITLAVLAELALLSLATDTLQVLLPVARFPGTLWLLGIAAVIARPGPGRARQPRSATR
jgi:hypothetical protein